MSSYFAYMAMISNPGLVMLDHVHFQYNCMLLGVLLILIACMVRGAVGGASSPSLSSLSSSSSLSQTICNNLRSAMQRANDGQCW